MGFVLNDGKGQRHGVASICEDISYAQAEVLHLMEGIKKSNVDPFVVGFPSKSPKITVQRFLDSYKNHPSELADVQAKRAEILSKGFDSLVKRSFPDTIEEMRKNSEVVCGRSLEELAVGFTVARDTGELSAVDDIFEFLQDIHANPLHAGVHQEFPATVMDSEWLSDASKAIRKFTPERWLRRLLAVLRFYFKGRPKILLPHNNDRCPCGSTRKYGKCCGRGIEHEDPEDCKLGKHVYSSWEKVEAKYVRSCERCYRAYDAPWFEESVFEGVKVTTIGCSACGQKPSADDIHKEIGRAITWHSCANCGKEFPLETMTLEHLWADGKHADRWVGTEMTHKEEAVDLQSIGLGKGAFLHKECFMKAFPSWPTVAKPLGKKAAADIVREIAPGS